MRKRKPRQGTPGQIVTGQRAIVAQNDSAASLARLMAERFDHLAQEVVESFQLGDRAQRVARLQRAETEILVGMQRVIGWLERNRPAETAELVKRRMDSILRTAVHCAGLEIPEYAGGAIAPVTGKPSLGARRTATLFVTAKAFDNSLQQWANDIEQEGEEQALGRGAQKRRRIPPAKRTKPMTLREAARLMGYGTSRDAAERLRAAIRTGAVHCESLTRQQHIFGLDDFPKDTWPKVKP